MNFKFEQPQAFKERGATVRTLLVNSFKSYGHFSGGHFYFTANRPKINSNRPKYLVEQSILHNIWEFWRGIFLCFRGKAFLRSALLPKISFSEITFF